MTPEPMPQPPPLQQYGHATITTRASLGDADPSRPVSTPLPPRITVEIPTGSGVWEQTNDTEAVLLVENKDFLFTGNIAAETDDGCCGVFALGPWDEVIVRNCSFTGFRQGVVVQGFTGTVGKLTIVDCEVITTVRQGTYASACDRITMKRDHLIDCGYHTLYDHAIYIQADCGPDVLVQDCAMVNAGSHAAQLRSGGVLHRNFVARCPIGLQIGLGNPPKPGGVFGSVTENVVVEGKDISPTDTRGMGFIMGNCNAVQMFNNLCWQNAGLQPCSLWLNGDGVAGPGVGAKNVTGTGNRVLNWKWGLRQDGVTTGFTSTAWGPSAVMPDTAPTLVLEALLGPTWVQKLKDRELSAFQCVQAVLSQEP